jgi:NTE family protein
LRSARIPLALSLAALVFSAAAADGPAGAPAAVARPRIGLVLGGGGAKGAAHIGVLKVLEEMRIPVDCIAGTSMGAIVGAAYATGLPATELEGVITGVQWKDILSSAPRQEVPLHRKSRDFAFSNGLEFGLQDGKVIPPGGLVPSHQIEGMFRRIVAGAEQVKDFDHLPIPFRAVATDLETGQMVVFDKGDLSVAMRASMAVPAAFAPVEHDGRLLVDGMLVRNVPIDVARKTCADVVIAVPVANPRVARDKLGTFVGVAGQAMNIAIEANENAQLATLTDKDVLIKVTLKDIGSSDFSKVPEAIPIGEAAARAAAQSLARYSLPPQAYAQWREGLGRTIAAAGVKVDEVRISGLSVTNEQVIKSMVHTQPGEIYDVKKAEADANRIVASGDFSAVSYGVGVQDGRNVLTYDAVEKPWGPDYLMFDLNLSTDFKGDTAWGIRVDYEKRWINRLGGEFRSSVQLGRPNVFSAQFYQPIDSAQRFFVAPSVLATQTLEYLYVKEVEVAQYDTRRYGASLDAGAAFSPWGEARVGVVKQGLDETQKVGIPALLPGGHHSLGGLTARFAYDSVDKRLFPTAGTRVQAEAYSSHTALGAEQDYRTLSFDATTSVSHKGNVWQFNLRGGSDFGSNAPFYDQFKAGGLFNFSGYRSGQLVGKEYGLASVQYRQRVGFLNETLGTAAYLGGTFELGNVFQRLDGTPSKGTLASGSAFLAVDSKIGPVYLAYGLSQGGRSMIYLYLGSSLETMRR